MIHKLKVSKSIASFDIYPTVAPYNGNGIEMGNYGDIIFHGLDLQ